MCEDKANDNNNNKKKNTYALQIRSFFTVIESLWATVRGHIHKNQNYPAISESKH